MGLFSRQPRAPQHELLDSVLGPTANLSGTLRSDGGLRIDGHFEGVVEVAGNVVVAEGARVLADITARNVTVGGAIKGNINGAGRLEILSTGQVVGDITVASMMIDEGGLFQGVSRMRNFEQLALTPPADDQLATPDAVPEVQVEQPRVEKVVETVDVKARPAEPPSPAASEAEPEPDIDFDIEPVIPDIVIEDLNAATPPRPPRVRRGRQGTAR